MPAAPLQVALCLVCFLLRAGQLVPAQPATVGHEEGETKGDGESL